MEEKLHCKAGHEWTRTRARGRKPEYCPEHLYLKYPAPQEAPPEPADEPAVQEVEEKPEPVSRAPVAALKARAQRVEQRTQSANKQAQMVIDNPLCEPELRHKLRYCLSQLKLGRTEISSTRDFYLSEAKRRGYVDAV